MEPNNCVDDLLRILSQYQVNLSYLSSIYIVTNLSACLRRRPRAHSERKPDFRHRWHITLDSRLLPSAIYPRQCCDSLNSEATPSKMQPLPQQCRDIMFAIRLKWAWACWIQVTSSICTQKVSIWTNQSFPLTVDLWSCSFITFFEKLKIPILIPYISCLSLDYYYSRA